MRRNSKQPWNSLSPRQPQLVPFNTQHPTLTIEFSDTMTSSFEPSLSTSGMRPPLASADAPSMADSLPSINFGFEDLRNTMAQFTVKFDAFIERGRKRVLEGRNQFHINLAEYEGMSLMVLKSTRSLCLTQLARGRAHATARYRNSQPQITNP